MLVSSKETGAYRQRQRDIGKKKEHLSERIKNTFIFGDVILEVKCYLTWMHSFAHAYKRKKRNGGLNQCKTNNQKLRLTKKKKLPCAFPDVGRSAKDEREGPPDSEKTTKHNK
jgi:hypothetical protein